MQAGEPPRHNEPLPQIVLMTRTQIEEEVNKNYEKIRNDIVDLIWEEINNPL